MEENDYLTPGSYATFLVNMIGLEENSRNKKKFLNSNMN